MDTSDSTESTCPVCTTCVAGPKSAYKRHLTQCLRRLQIEEDHKLATEIVQQEYGYDYHSKEQEIFERASKARQWSYK